MKRIEQERFFLDYLSILSEMYKKGWDERNGGNVSYLLNKEEEKKIAEFETLRTIPLPLEADEVLRDRAMLVTGTGKYFRNCERYPSENVGLIRISSNGKEAELLYGFDGNASFTSEIFAHLLCHATRLKMDPLHQVVIHTHPTNFIALNHLREPDEKKWSLELWRAMTECIVVFPEGVGMLPWMVCGNLDIGVATAKKMEEFRFVGWYLHGAYCAGRTLDEAFGLIETVEKAAEIVLKVGKEEVSTMSDDNLMAIANRFSLVPNKKFL